MSKGSENELGELHGAITRGLTEVINQGELVDIKEDGTEVRKTASAAFFMAGITMLKNNNITADASTNEALKDLEATIAARRHRGKARMSLKEAVADAEATLDAMGRGLMQ